MSLNSNLLVMAGCYFYILFIIIFSGKLDDTITTKKISRKVLHALIGNLPFIMPYFTGNIYPFIVAFSFVIVTLLASPFSPFKYVRIKMKNLVDITDEGHKSGLILYAVSYSILALFFGVYPYVVASGIFPMAYGDSAAALIGESRGRYKFSIFEEKSLEGSLGMFLGCFFSLIIGMRYFSTIYGFSFIGQIVPVLSVSFVTTIVEAVSPRGTDNLTIPLLGALTFLVTRGGL